tara:strand:+ start:1413 stop:2300 length:888 start_codon:yes stop_codon:yes gene_type:complete
MINLYIKQVGINNFFWQGLKLKLIKMFKKEFSYSLITNNNYKIHRWDPSAAEVYITQCFSDWGNEYLFLDSLENRENKIFFDVGCHSGYYPCLFNNYFEKIVGFEPSQKCFDILKNLDNDKNSYYQCFVGDKNIKVKCTESETGYSYYNKITKYKKTNLQELEQITIDDFCKKNKINNLNAIKIDVDGIDLKVLYGGKNTIESNRPSILIENYSSELFEFFNDLDYSLLSMVALKEKPFDLNLEELKNFDPSKWIKMICCVPSEFKKNYKKSYFKGSILSGINKKEILKNFNFKL